MIVFLRALAIGFVAVAVVIGGLIVVAAGLDPQVQTVEKTLPNDRFGQ